MNRAIISLVIFFAILIINSRLFLKMMIILILSQIVTNSNLLLPILIINLHYYSIKIWVYHLKVKVILVLINIIKYYQKEKYFKVLILITD